MGRRSLQVRDEYKEKVNNALTNLGLTQEVFAETRLQISRSTVSNFLRCKPIYKENFIKICKALDLDWQEITTLTKQTRQSDEMEVAQILNTSSEKDSMIELAILRELKEVKSKHQKSVAFKLAVQSEMIREQQHSYIERAVLLAVESVKLHHSVETDSALRKGLALLPRPIATLKNENKKIVNSIAFSPDGQYLATASCDNISRIWQWHKNKIKPIKSLKYISQYQSNLEEAYINDYRHSILKTFLSSDYLITLHEESFEKLKSGFYKQNHCTLCVRKIDNGKLIDGIPFSKYYPLYFAFGTNNFVTIIPKPLFFGSNPANLILFKHIFKDMLENKIAIEVTSKTDAVAWSPVKNLLAISDRSKVALVLTSSNKVIQIIDRSNVFALNFNLNNRYLALAISDPSQKGSAIAIWDIENKKEITNIPIDGVFSFALSPDGRYLAVSIEFDRITHIWEIKSNKEVARINHNDRVKAGCLTQVSER